MRTFRLQAALLAVAISLAAATALAETPLERYQAAAKAFEALRQEAQAKGERPRMSDPRVASRLAILADKDAQFGTPDFPAATGMDICSIPTRIAVDYMMMGAEPLIREFQAGGGKDAARFKQSFDVLRGKNAVIYQDEIVPLNNFARHCMAATLPVLTTFFVKLPAEQRTPVRLDGLKKMRLGIREMITGSLRVNDAAVKLEHRKLMFEGMKGDLALLTTAMSADDRAVVVAAMESARASAGAEYQAGLAAMIDTIKKAPCEGLCQF